MEKEEKVYQPLIEPELAWVPVAGDPFAGEFIVQPLEPGFGITLGNALRRVILSFVEGSAITSVIIEGANNEFAVLGGVYEDVLQVLMNLKKLVIKNSTGLPGVLTVSKKGSGPILASDIEVDSHLEIVNKDLHLAMLSVDGSLNMKMFVEVGRGYRLAAWPTNTKFHEDGKIYIDSLFCPIIKVAYNVEKTRVGQSIDYDKLILTIKTNGAIDPKESIEYAASVLRSNCKFLLQSKDDINFGANPQLVKDSSSFISTEGELEPVAGIPVDLFTKTIETLELSVRAQNCLDSAEIRTVLELVNLTDEEALKIKNFGRKTLKEVKEVLVGLGLRLGMNIKTHDLKKARKDNSSLNISRFG